MKRICIGITELTPGWQAIFDQIGVWYKEVDFSTSLTEKYSVIIISKPLTNHLQKKLAAYLHHGGCLLIPKKVKSFNATEKSPKGFSVKVPFQYQENTHLYVHGDGVLIMLGYNPDDDMANNKYGRKRFYFKSEMHPDELVSVIHKAQLKKSIDACLHELHLHRQLPYIKKWHSPTKQPVFAFRVDSDFGDQDSIKRLYEIARRHDIPMTWFLHVQAHEDWLTVFKDFEAQEIALHGYDHGTSTSYVQIKENIQKGLELMQQANLHPKGFCVPYALWNEGLANALYDFDFEYSSEFTAGYDSDPFYPIHEGALHPTLQIPIHPICTGSLSRKLADETDMKSYFMDVLDRKVNRFENVLFYHHPLQPGTDIWNMIFEKVNQMELTKLTFLEFSTYWKARQNTTIETYYSSEKKEIHCSSSNPEQLISVSMSSDSFYLIPASKIDAPLNFADKIHFEDITEPSQADLIELEAHPFELYKTNILDWRNRKKL